MTVVVPHTAPELGPAVLAHLAAQLESARRLLDAVLRQGAATRRQDVDAVLSCLSEIQGEMERRGRLETERANLLSNAAAVLGRRPHEVTLDDLTSLMPAADAEIARERSAELRGLLAEIQREHQINRALMRQELSFLEHLTRLVGAEEEVGYRPPGDTGSRPAGTVPQQSHRVLDLRA